MSAVDQLFADLRSAGKKALMPFVTAGDPDLQFTADVLQELDARGASMCEVGLPYSDPIADGPVIQASYTRALQQGVKLRGVLETLGGATRKMSAPVVTMVSYAIVYRHGLQRYVAEAKAAGVSGAIVPDLLVEEAEPLAEICRREDFNLIQLVTPTTPRDRAVRIAKSSTGFLYYVSVTGITGERSALPQDLTQNIEWLRTQTNLPICVGFGINSVEHVELLGPVADGLIVGSAIVRRIAKAQTGDRDEALADVGRYVASLVKALEGC